MGFETYQAISQAAMVHATAKALGVEEILEQADYLYESGDQKNFISCQPNTRKDKMQSYSGVWPGHHVI